MVNVRVTQQLLVQLPQLRLQGRRSRVNVVVVMRRRRGGRRRLRDPHRNAAVESGSLAGQVLLQSGRGFILYGFGKLQIISATARLIRPIS